MVTKTILQNIQVLSAGTDIQRDSEGKPQQVQVVTLLVTPEQAQIAEPGRQFVEDPIGAAQSAGHADRAEVPVRHDGQLVRQPHRLLRPERRGQLLMLPKR